MPSTWTSAYTQSSAMAFYSLFYPVVILGADYDLNVAAIR